VSKEKASTPAEEIMEFIEQPLTYAEARRGVWKFERTYKVPSAAVFSGKCESHLNIGSDVLFEWKSYYEFVCEVDRRIASALADRRELGEVMYSSKSVTEAHPQTSEQRKQVSLCLAA